MHFSSLPFKISILIGVSLFSCPSTARQMLTGDVQAREGKTFSFPAKACCITESNHIYLGACQPGAKNFALCFLNPGGNEFKPYAPEVVAVDGVADQKNPLFDAAILYLAQLDSRNIVAVTQADPTVLYTMDSTTSAGEILSQKEIFDASGVEKNGGICALVATGKDLAFVAVKGAGQSDFGDGMSGIALVAFIMKEEEHIVSDQEFAKLQEKLKGADDQAIQKALSLIRTNEKGQKVKKVTVKTFRHLDGIAAAAPFSKKSSFLKVGSDLHAMDDIKMHWSPALNRLYVALRVQAGPAAGDGACAIAVGYFDEQNTLCFAPVISHTLLCHDQNQIVGGLGAGAKISIKSLCTLQTGSGFLDYLIIAGGNDTCRHEGSNMVFALPLLNMRNLDGEIAPAHQKLHGTLACVKGSPHVGFREKNEKVKSSVFLGRHFVTAPQESSDLYTMDSDSARVGAGPLAAGPIERISVKDDAVYAVVMRSENPGVYHSQAIFDADGHIAAWTAWQKVLESERPIWHVAVDRNAGKNVILTGDDSQGIRSVERDEWYVKPVSRGLENLMQEGGVQNLLSFPAGTPGLNTMNLLCIVGTRRCALTVMGQDESIHFEGGMLDQLKPLTCAEIGATATNGWFFVGGVNGVALLCDEQGKGWPMPEGLDKSLRGLRAGMAFKKIGDYRWVKKLICDEQFLYVLTDSYLDRVDLRLLESTGTCLATRLADMHDLAHAQQGILYDVIISEKFAVIAHSGGLSRVGNGRDIRCHDVGSLDWTAVALPGSLGPAVCMNVVSQTGRPQDAARGCASQLYVITGISGKDRAHLHRLVIHSVLDRAIDDNTLAVVQDNGTQEGFSWFANLGMFSSLFATDGTIFFTAFDKKNKKPLSLISAFGPTRTKIPLPFAEGTRITSIIREQETGKWLIAGDFGLIAHD